MIRVRRKFAALALVALFVLPALGVAVGASAVTVAPVEASYELGEEVELSGSASPGSNVTLVESNGSTYVGTYT